MKSKNEWDEKNFIFDFVELRELVCTCDGRRDKEEERSISHDPVKVEIVNDGVMIHFMVPLGEVSVQVINDTNDLVYREEVIVDSSLSYYIFINRPLCYKLFIIGDGINMDIPILSE